MSQDELLGLADNSQEGYLAEEMDPTVVHRQVEDRQVQLRFNSLQKIQRLSSMRTLLNLVLCLGMSVLSVTAI